MDVSDVAEPTSARRRAASTTCSPPSARSNGKWLAVPHGIVGNAVAYRKSWLKEIGVDASSRRPGTSAREVGKKLKDKGKPVRPDARPQLRRPADLRLPLLWDFGGAETDKTRQEGRAQLQGHDRVGQVHAGVLEGRPATRAGWPGTTPTTTAPSTPARSRPRSTAPPSTSWPSARRTRSRTRRASRCSWTSSTRAAPGRARRAVSPSTSPFQHAVMKYSKNQKLAKDFLSWLHQKENYGKWFEVNEGYTRRRHQGVGGASHVGQASTSRSRSSAAPRGRTRMLGYPGPSTAKATESYTKYIVVDMYAKAVQGMKAEDAVQVGRGRAQEDLRGMSARPDMEAQMSEADPRTCTDSGRSAARSWPAPPPRAPRPGSRASSPRAARPPSRRARSSTSLRWVDFIPACDVELKRQARRRLQGARRRGPVRVHQRQRPAAAHHRGHPVGQRARHHHDAAQLAPPLRERPRRRDRPRRVAGQGPGRLYAQSEAVGQGGGKRWLALPHGIVACRSPTGSRGSTEVGATRCPKTLRGAAPGRHEAQEEGPAVGQTLGHTFGDAPAWAIRSCGPSAARRPTRAARRRARHQGDRRVGQVHAGVLEGRLRRGRARLGRHQQQPRLPRRRDLRAR